MQEAGFVRQPEPKEGRYGTKTGSRNTGLPQLCIGAILQGGTASAGQASESWS